MEAVANIFRQGNRLGITEDLDRLACGVDDQPAVRAPGEMLFEVDPNTGVYGSIEIAGEFEYNFLAVHCVSLRRKYLFSFWRSFSRARKRRDFTAATEMPRICAVSSVETPSTSRNRKTTRKIGSSSPITSLRMVLSSVCANRCSGDGPQSSISRKTESSSLVSGSSMDTWLGRRLRNFISASLTAMRTNHV